MKSQESDGKWMVDFTAQICEKFPDRYSCTESEHQAQEWIKDKLGEFCDETFVDSFETYPKLYPIGLVKVSAFFLALTPLFIAMRFPFPIVSFALVVLGFTVLITHLFGQKEWISFLFKKGTSHNAFGIVKPTDEVKWRIVIEGHTDAAIQMHMAEFEGKVPLWKLFLGLTHIVYTPIIALVKFFMQWFNPLPVFGEWGPFSWTILDYLYYIPLIVTFPLFLLVIRGFTGKVIVPGANDNLSGAAVATAVGRYYAKPENRLKHVELWVGSQGSEEVGDQGARAFVEKYGPQGVLDNAYALVPDSAGAGERILIVRKDKMHNAVHSPEILDRLGKAYEQAKAEWPEILPMEFTDLPFGSSDACRYIHKGYKASMLIVTGKESKKPLYWHALEDKPENLETKVLRSVLELYLNFVEIVDKEYRDK